MKLAFLLALAVVLGVPAAAQMMVHRPINPAIARKPVPQASSAVLRSETPETCAARNAFLKQKVVPALQQQLAQLQAEIADRRAHSYTCSPDLRRSISGNGGSADCGVYVCNPVDGLCRSWAKTSEDCSPGYLWDGFRSCVPAY